MYRSALVALKPALNQGYVLDHAIAWARKHEWRLRVGTVIDADRVVPVEPVPLGGGAYKHERDEQLMRKAHDAADGIVKQVEESFRAAQITGTAQVFAGSTVDVLRREVQENDLLMVGHSGGDDTGDESLLFQILKHAPRPAVVVPRQVVTGQNIVVAYDGSFQAARTLAALVQSGISSSEPVHIISCHSDPVLATDHAQRARRFLEHHQISAITHAESVSSSPADFLLSRAAQLQAGLLVMGAFGKTAMHEFFLGSVTRSILHRLPMPVLLDH
jgi:nucleotide-binding universal stress UspA family protein